MMPNLTSQLCGDLYIAGSLLVQGRLSHSKGHPSTRGRLTGLSLKQATAKAA